MWNSRDAEQKSLLRPRRNKDTLKELHNIQL
jgi:hypothetical protein